MKKIRCSLCGKKMADIEALKNHSIMKHGDPDAAKAIPVPERGDDESMASRAIQAEMDIAMGLGSDDAWLLP
jgi:hypothetical protein